MSSLRIHCYPSKTFEIIKLMFKYTVLMFTNFHSTNSIQSTNNNNFQNPDLITEYFAAVVSSVEKIKNNRIWLHIFIL
ncbi:hypothetical protein DERF_004889 [Dermatophagoides farinae]|uniref:Uncharacterized protein n=1 Tax=Dermatophagoides farinae TaxID=6954 RepID=A0A922L5N8_DERFA|nr:hypothetical protein DERF_004889 [Dermatophagoides farinae]